MTKYDVLVVGGGPGGYVAAIKASHLGYKVGLIEKHKLGGVCLNYGCIPTKTLLRTAKLYKDMLKASSFGIKISNPSDISIDWDNMMLRKDEVVNKLVTGVAQLIKHNKIDLIIGLGNVVDPNHVEVSGQVYACDKLILATGSSPTLPAIPGLKESFDQNVAINSRGAIQLKELPQSMIVLGGGVVAIEFATLYQNLGTDVTILQRSDHILKSLDKDVRMLMTRELKKMGIKIETGVAISKIDGNKIYYEKKGQEKTVQAEKILVSLGRKPNLKGLEALNLAMNTRGVNTDDQMQTNVAGVYAIGDMNGEFMLAHVASAEGIVASEAISGKKTKINYNKVPSCIYSFPEIGVVGLSEEAALQQGYKVKTSMFPLTANGKALAEGESSGFVKIVSDETYGEVIGVHIVASHATDMIAEAVATMELEGTVHDLARTVHPHPTLSEIVMEAAHGAVDKPIHSISK